MRKELLPKGGYAKDDGSPFLPISKEAILEKKEGWRKKVASNKKNNHEIKIFPGMAPIIVDGVKKK